MTILANADHKTYESISMVMPVLQWLNFLKKRKIIIEILHPKQTTGFTKTTIFL